MENNQIKELTLGNILDFLYNWNYLRFDDENSCTFAVANEFGLQDRYIIYQTSYIASTLKTKLKTFTFSIKELAKVISNYTFSLKTIDGIEVEITPFFSYKRNDLRK